MKTRGSWVGGRRALHGAARRSCHRAGRLALAVLVGFAAQPGAAQEPQGLTLGRVVEAAIAGSAEMEVAALSLRGREAELLTSSGVFDPTAQLSVGGAREMRRAVAVDGSAAAAIEQGRSSYRVGVTKRLRWGALVQPQVTVTRSAANALTPLSTTVAAVDLGLTIPLLRDRGGVATRSGERSAEVRYAAEGHAYRHSAEQSVLQGVTTYWRYLSASMELSVREESAARASVLVEETRALVDADERPAADLNHVVGNLTTKRMTVLAAEQAIAEARRDLGHAMGLPAEDIARIPSPVTAFPAWQPRGATDLNGLVELALDSRSDLAAVRERVRAELVLADAARSETRPRLDLSVSVGYSGSQIGGGFAHYFSPLYRDVPGTNLAVELTYDVPLRADRARGMLARQESFYEQARVSQRDLARRIAAQVAVAAEALDRASQTVEAALYALELHRVTVESEKLKHSLGDATLFDIIHAEDALTSVELGEVRARLEQATATALLRFHTGTLVAYHIGDLRAPPAGRDSAPDSGPGAGP